MSTLDIKRIQLDAPLYVCDMCRAAFTDRNALEGDCAQFETPDRHICTYCYGFSSNIKYVPKNPNLFYLGQCRTALKYQVFEQRTGEDGRPYRYYFDTPKLIGEEQV